MASYCYNNIGCRNSCPSGQSFYKGSGCETPGQSAQKSPCCGRPGQPARKGSCSSSAHGQPCGGACQEWPLAMVWIKMQRFQDTYPLCKALQMGTIFPELCKPFCGKRGGCR